MSLLAVVTFIPSLLINYLLMFITSRKWYDRIDETVILGALPFAYLTRELVDGQNVKAVVSLNSDYELWLANGRKEWEDAGVEFMQQPITDLFDTPDMDTLTRCIDFINRFIPNNSKQQDSPNPSVYVHCKAGRTRSATVVGCYLMQRYGWTPEEAVKHMTKKRSHIWLLHLQWRTLREFYQHLNQSKEISR